MSVPLSIAGVTKRYGSRTILDGVTLSLAPGETVVLRGPNGTGKSTLLGCVCGQVVPDAGTIAIAGFDLRSAPLQARRHLRALPQEVELPAGITGREWLEIHADVFGAPRPSDAEVDPQLRPLLDHLAATYSVGLRRRLAFAAIALGPAALFVLDEPFAGVDTDGRARILEVLQARLGDGAAVLLAAHDHELGEIERLSPRIVALAPAAA
ncbi:MAG: ATP-binding cassette domain-containing protein [Nannocystaceae bacterium]|nr:ATP-binding cassette domain-containing protein [Nannocystaceae bacterium]